MKQLQEVTNEHGFVQWVDEDLHPTCPSCGCMVMVNRGQGTNCDKCNHDANVEMSHDHEENNLMSINELKGEIDFNNSVECSTCGSFQHTDCVGSASDALTFIGVGEEETQNVEDLMCEVKNLRHSLAYMVNNIAQPWCVETTERFIAIKKQVPAKFLNDLNNGRAA